MTPDQWACVAWCVVGWVLGVAPVWWWLRKRTRDPWIARGPSLDLFALLHGLERRRWRWLGVTWWRESDRSLRRRCVERWKLWGTGT